MKPASSINGCGDGCERQRQAGVSGAEQDGGGFQAHSGPGCIDTEDPTMKDREKERKGVLIRM